MLYTEYQTAAEKHLKACTEALEMLKQKEKLDENPTKPLTKSQKFLLMDVYYLSGYIFECMITFAIYKKAFEFHGEPPFDSSQSVGKEGKDFFGTGGAYYHNPPHFQFAFFGTYSDKLHSDTKHTAGYHVHKHDFQKNAELLNIILSGNTIPFISDKVSTDTSKQSIYRLIEKWKPEKRYQIENPFLTFAQVDELIKLAYKFYIEVIQEIGI